MKKEYAHYVPTCVMVIDVKNAKVIDKANNRTWKILESWHTAKTAQADNNSFNLPGQYKILLDKH